MQPADVIATSKELSRPAAENPIKKKEDILIYLVVEPTHLKNMNVNMGSSSPKFRGVNKTYLSCHHLVIKGGNSFTLLIFPNDPS